MQMSFRKNLIVSIAIILVGQGCKTEIPDQFLVPQTYVTGNEQVILDYIWLDGCVDCQLMEASRWIRRQKDLERMGKDYSVSIICLIVNLTEDRIHICDFLSCKGNNIHYIYTKKEIDGFFLQDTRMLPCYNFTCLLDSNGRVILKGGNPKKDMESFKRYTSLIHSNNH